MYGGSLLISFSGDWEIETYNLGERTYHPKVMPSKMPQLGSDIGKVLLYHDQSLVRSPRVAQVSWVHPLNNRSYNLQHFCCLSSSESQALGIVHLLSGSRWIQCMAGKPTSSAPQETPFSVLHSSTAAVEL